MHNPRFLLPGKIHFITFRTEEGLLFVPMRFMNILIHSALARFQRLCPVRIPATGGRLLALALKEPGASCY